MSLSDWLLRSATCGDIAHFSRIDEATNKQAALDGHPEFDDGQYIPDEIARRAIAEGRITVAEVEGEVVAWMLVTRCGDEACIGQISVLPDRQRSGLGSALMAAAIADLEKAGEQTLVLNTQSDLPYNQPFYEKLDFVVVPEGEWTEGMRAVTESQSAGGLDWSTRVHMRRSLGHAS